MSLAGPAQIQLFTAFATSLLVIKVKDRSRHNMCTMKQSQRSIKNKVVNHSEIDIDLDSLGTAIHSS
jgi:hypothetical protein